MDGSAGRVTDLIQALTDAVANRPSREPDPDLYAALAAQRDCPECGQRKVRHDGEWWCPDDLANLAPKVTA